MNSGSQEFSSLPHQVHYSHFGLSDILRCQVQVRIFEDPQMTELYISEGLSLSQIDINIGGKESNLGKSILKAILLLAKGTKPSHQTNIRPFEAILSLSRR